MGASIWRVGQTSEDQLMLGRSINSPDIGRRMWMTGWGQVSGEWNEHQKIS